MRRILIALAFLALLTSFTGPKSIYPFTITWRFAGIEEGYDHDNKCIVWIDGTQAGESTVTRESQQNSMTVTLTRGEHHVRVVNYALYEGEWEEHTIANDYSLDCTFDDSHTFGKKNKLFLLFDIDNGTATSWKKMPKVKK